MQEVAGFRESLVSLSRNLGAWPALPNLSRWLIWTILFSYAIQFTRCPPRFRGILFILITDRDAPAPCAEIVLLVKDAIEPVPPAKMKSRFYSPFFIIPKKTVQRQYNVLFFGLCLSPRIFTKVTEDALSLLWEKGIKVLT